ncbi:uncharacterized protein LOC111394893 [Olea europaea var. sylvestris]|uniref:uncharacterized protein LOC111394893 n=1 Tax=Olea europaea var. sylvestris TaxID=158386 RepID=UPI000C1D0093|nr:uncharacterized protein LOC111394893 [Olea europaea var. sylvestris]
MLASRFEEIRIKDDESFDEFYAKLNDIVNSSFNLGKRILESKIVRKVLRSLPKRFRPKVTATEESKDLDTVKIEELVGSLQTYELTISQPRKNKSITLNTIREEESESSVVETLRDEEIVYFVKKFQKVLKGKKWPQEKMRGVPSKLQREKNDKSTARNPSKKSQVIRCHECQGFGHYRNECPNFKKNLKKGRSRALVVSLTDDDSNSSEQSDSSSSEEEKGYMAFVSTVKNESDKESEKVEEEVESNKSGDDSEDETDIHEAYQFLFKESLKIKKNLSEVKCVNEKLEDRVKTLTCELEKSSTQLQSFMSGTKKLDDLLGMNKPAGNRQGPGIVKSDDNVSSLSKTTFVPTSNRSNVSTNPESKDKNFTRLKATKAHKISTPKFQDQHSRASEPRFIPTCHHCGAVGHTRPRCRKLVNRNRSQDIPSQHIRLKIHACGILIVLVLDTCGNKVLFSTFDDCNDGLKSNLLSISQICDADYEVSFDKKRCTIYDLSSGVVLEGVRISDNCYGVLPNSNYVYSSAKIDMSELWHQRLDHVNYRSLSKLVKKKIVYSLPKIDQSENASGEPRKQRYILVVVEDFSRYTWIKLLREKSETGDLQNRVVERKNRVLQEMARAMLHGKDLAMHFWGEAINTACHIVNRVYLRPNIDKTPYEIWKGKKPTVKYFCLFHSKCYILRDKENLGNFDSKSDDESVLESVNVVIDDAITEGESTENGVDIEDLSDDQGATAENKEQSIPKSPRSSENISDQGLPNYEGMRLRKRVLNNLTYTSYVSHIEPKKVKKALRDECWVNA